MIPLKAVSTSHKEQVQGIGYLLFQLLVLPSLLVLLNRYLPSPMDAVQMNFCFYCINFLAVILILRKFLGSSLKGLGKGFWPIAESAVLGLVGYEICNLLLARVIISLHPDFANVNDAQVAALLQGNRWLMTVGTVLLAPLAEECLFRGLIFRRLYSISHPGAYILSVLLFGAIHVMGYWGQASHLTLVLCFVQYIPAGIWLAWAYRRGGNIFASVLMHSCINAIGIYLMR